MRALRVIVIFCLILGSRATAGDLYRVELNSPRDAVALKSININALLQTNNTCLLLLEKPQVQLLRASGLEHSLLATDIRRDHLAIDRRFDRKNTSLFKVLYEEEQFRLLLVDWDMAKIAGNKVEVFPLPDIEVDIEYQAPVAGVSPSMGLSALEDLQLLMDRVSQDSLESYVNRLVAFYRRVTGTSSNYAARDWISSKFREFGYDSVVTDPFTGARLWDRTPCAAANVIAYKTGTVYPNQHIIIGGHFDAVPESPGADDNASGTAAVLECARILKDIETDMTIIFIAFDSEESGLLGATHYVEGAVERNDDIVLMINADMIAHFENSDRADVYSNGQNVYAQLWDQLGNAYVGIDADLGGMGASDHWPFQMAGYDVIFVQEKIFSTVYHTENDKTAYMDFEYMTRMVKATLATAYSTNASPPPVRIAALEEPGDGHSFVVHWNRIDAPTIARYELTYYPMLSPLDITTIDFGPEDTSFVIDGLTEGAEYCVSVLAYDYSDVTSIKTRTYYFTPRSLPAAPFDILAMPLKDAVKLTWSYSNAELDFDHCAVLRDGMEITQTLDTFFVDDDAALGNALHDYRVVAVDAEGNLSDTLSIVPFGARAATLAAGRVLAVNRTQIYSNDFVDERETGEYLRLALDGYDFDYFSDTTAVSGYRDCSSVELNDMIDYELVVIGAETARYEDIGVNPVLHGLLDTLGYYLSIGGKVIIFGRWGTVGGINFCDYTTTAWTYDDGYHDLFHINGRFITPTPWEYGSTYLPADLVGARSRLNAYPHLVWDSSATLSHSTSQDIAITDVAGVPCATYVRLDSSKVDVIYGYDSRNNSDWEGQPVAWRYFGDDYSYVFFDIPLSFFERNTAIAALKQAVDEILSGTPSGEENPDGGGGGLPVSFALSQNYPNPFNPLTRIDVALPQACHVKLEVFNILGQRVAKLIDRDMQPGNYDVYWDGSGVASGLYLYRLRAGSFEQSKKMILVR